MMLPSASLNSTFVVYAGRRRGGIVIVLLSLCFGYLHLGLLPAASPDAVWANNSQIIAPNQGPDTNPYGVPVLQGSSAEQRISVTVDDTPISTVLNLIAEQQGLNVITSGDVSQKITVKLTKVLLADALNSILPANGLTWVQQNNIIVVSNVSGETKGPAIAQGREVRVFTLNYSSATDAQLVVKGLLSPVGQAFVNESVSSDHRRTQEQLVIEDLPMYVRRVEEYIAQVDRPPRQVLVEAHVLQVELSDDLRHGIDLQQILRIAGSPITLQAKNFTSGGSPAGMLSVDGTDLNGVIEAIKSTTDSKTLASPKVAVLNGQKARIQVGGQIGYLLTTTTQTSTLQSVNFLDVGVILEVTPTITDDNQIVMDVSPEVSTGRINATTSLPESETTQLQTRIMLADGEALLIGGLIKESNVDSRAKIPWLGDLWVVGKLFQRRNYERERSEIIIALLPRILPDVPCGRSLHCAEVDQARTPLFHGVLQPMDRRQWEPTFPDPSACGTQTSPTTSVTYSTSSQPTSGCGTVPTDGSTPWVADDVIMIDSDAVLLESGTSSPTEIPADFLYLLQDTE